MIDGPAPLLQKVIDAVRSWTFLSTMLDGKPVEVVIKITLDFEGASPPSSAAGVVGGIMGGVPVAPPPPLPPRRDDAPYGPAYTSGSVLAANLIKKVDPVYPPKAKIARVQGVVEFTALIGTDGTVKNLQLVQGHPLLVDAAREAVSQWEYKPVTIDGKPVEVVTDIKVNFTLSP